MDVTPSFGTSRREGLSDDNNKNTVFASSTSPLVNLDDWTTHTHVFPDTAGMAKPSA